VGGWVRERERGHYSFLALITSFDNRCFVYIYYPHSF
jgi:hypothetical protein